MLLLYFVKNIQMIQLYSSSSSINSESPTRLIISWVIYDTITLLLLYICKNYKIAKNRGENDLFLSTMHFTYRA